MFDEARDRVARLNRNRCELIHLLTLQQLQAYVTRGRSSFDGAPDHLVVMIH